MSTELEPVDGELVVAEPGVPAGMVLVRGVPMKPQHVAGVKAAADRAVAESTRKAYLSSWRTWEAWCARHGYPSLPASPLHIAAWVDERATGEVREDGTVAAPVAMSTVTKDVAGVRWVQINTVGPDGRPLPDPTAPDPALGDALGVVLQGLRRTHGTAPKAVAHALITHEIKVMLDGIDRTTLRGKRDAAIILLGYAAALRRSEVADLDVRDVDLTKARRGIALTIRKSKGDQEGESRVVGVARGEHPETDPVVAVQEWLTAAGIAKDPNAPLFQRIAPGGNRPIILRPRKDGALPSPRLTGKSIATIIMQRAEAAGLGTFKVSGHSLRAGHITQASERGIDSVRIMKTSRHAKVDTLARYVRVEEALQGTTSAELGL